MSGTVSVLAPNGRRQTVKYNPNMTIMQILEEVCRKQGLKPEMYDIKHHNKIIDTTLTFRFSGLPNNAQLEMASVTKARVDTEVTLAVNLEDGGRLIGNFYPDQTLWDILLQLCPKEVTTNPVVIYMRSEICGEKLKETTLKNLGLRGGRAMIRVLHKTPEELRNQANVSSPIVPPVISPVAAKPEELEFWDADETPVKVQRKNDVDLLKLAKEQRKLPQPSHSPGLEKRAKPDTVQRIEGSEPTLKKADKSKKQTKGAVSEQSPPQEPQRPVEEEFIFLGERNAMIFSLESAHSVPSEELPDDFFELTIDDAKKILKDIKRKRNEMENSNLKTAVMRDLEETKKQLRYLGKYKQSVIRVQFPDRVVLQGTFKPTETVDDVLNFTRAFLEDPSQHFHLYTTPPKSILAPESRLLEIGCVPGALLHLGFLEENTTRTYLKPEFLNQITSKSMASLAASKMRKDTTTASVESELSMEIDETSESQPGPSSNLTSYERKVVKTTEKVPKWFKTGK